MYVYRAFTIGEVLSYVPLLSQHKIYMFRNMYIHTYSLKYIFIYVLYHIDSFIRMFTNIYIMCTYVRM
jgi:hypothetical protein